MVGAKAGGLPSKPHTAATHRDGAKMAKAAPKPAEDAKPLDTKTATEVSKPKADVKPPTITKASADRIGAGGGIRAVIEAEKEKARLVELHRESERDRERLLQQQARDAQVTPDSWVRG